jgi:hypothetical protein
MHVIINFLSMILWHICSKARTVEPEKHPLLANGPETTFIARQQILNKQDQMAAARELLSEHVPAATDMKMNNVFCVGYAEES